MSNQDAVDFVRAVPAYALAPMKLFGLDALAFVGVVMAVVFTRDFISPFLVFPVGFMVAKRLERWTSTIPGGAAPHAVSLLLTHRLVQRFAPLVATNTARLWISAGHTPPPPYCRELHP